MKIILVKVGGSSITVKKDLETLDRDALKWFSKTVATSIHDSYTHYDSPHKQHTPTKEKEEDNDEEDGHEEIYSMIIVHGAGSFGHHSAKAYGLRGHDHPPSDTDDLRAYNQDHSRKMMSGLVKTRHSVKKLNSAVVSHLLDEGVNAVGISPCMNIPNLLAHGGDEKGGVTILVQAILQSLTAGIIPVIHGDAGLYGYYKDQYDKLDDPCKKMASAGILGGDRLVEIIASHKDLCTSIERVVFLTDVKGVYTKDPKVYANEAVLVREILVDPITGSLKIDHDDDDSNGNISASGSTHDHDVTGGLETKLDAAVNVAKVGIPVIITQCGSVSAEQAVKGGMIQCTSCNDYLTSEGTIIRIKQ